MHIAIQVLGVGCAKRVHRELGRPAVHVAGWQYQTIHFCWQQFLCWALMMCAAALSNMRSHDTATSTV
jgi:hypothetical protein